MAYYRISNMKIKTIVIKMPEDLFDASREFCKARGIKRAALIRLLLSQTIGQSNDVTTDTDQDWSNCKKPAKL